MDSVIVFDVSDGQVVCLRCGLADSPWRRLRGLMGRRELAPVEGMLMRRSNSIHTCFMRFPIDAIFLDEEGHVVRVCEHLRPWRSAVVRGARAVLELPAGQGRRRGIEVGQRLSVWEAR
jgi:uncharacterized protein